MQKTNRIIIALALALGIYAFQFTFLCAKTAVLTREGNLTGQDRQMMFFSESAFYFSYFHRLATAPSMGEELGRLRHDSRFTYPDAINATKKFNIWQEIILAGLYRLFARSAEPVVFYTYGTIAVHALIPVVIFLAIVFLSSRIWMGLGGFAAYFSVAEFASRIYSYPGLRENFGLPFIIGTGVLTVFYIRRPKNAYLPWIWLSTVAQGVFWQFSMVPAALKTAALFVYWLINPGEKVQVQRLCLVDLFAYLALVVLYWGNTFYLNPMYLAPVVTLLYLTFYRLPNRWLNGAAFVGGSAGLYFVVNKLLGLAGSSHMTAFFLDRFFGIKSFDSQLYRVIGAFNGIFPAMILYFTKGLLLPLFAIALAVMAARIKIKTAQNHEVFLMLVVIGYLLLGIAINRFIVISLPLIVVFSLVMINSLWDSEQESRPSVPNLPKTISLVVLMSLALAFLLNLGEFKRRTAVWINRGAVETSERLKRYVGPSDVIAADMVLSSSLALLMDNPLVLHPQFEYPENRRRCKLFNRAYGYTGTEYMHTFFKSLDADYVVLQYDRCFNAVENGINMREAIHLDFPKQTDDLFCARDFTGSPLFTTVEQSKDGRILKVL